MSHHTLVFAVESWVIAVLGVTWLSIKSLLLSPSFADDLIIYSQGVFASMNLILISLLTEKRNVCQSYFIIVLLLWFFAVCVGIDSFKDITMDKHNVPASWNMSHSYRELTNSTLCCPNYLYSLWNRYTYFNGLEVYPAPFAVTLAFQTIHVIIAAAGLSNTQSTLYPGASLAHGIFCTGVFLLNIKFLGYFHPPCVSENVDLFDGFLIIRIKILFALFCVGFMSMAAIEDAMTSPKLRIFWYAVSVFLVVIFYLAVYVYLYGYNLISWSWIGLQGAGVALFLFSLFSTINPNHVAEVRTELKERIKSRSRFVLPMQATLAPLPKAAKDD